MSAVGWVTPTGAGTQSGNSFSNAAPSAVMQSMHDTLTDGDRIAMLAVPGYTYTATLNWSKRIGVGGYQADGTTRGYPVISGARTWPWPANGVWTDSGRYSPANAGLNWLNFKDGAGATGGATFDYLSFAHVGTPIRPLFASNAVTGQVNVDHIRTFNSNGLVYIESSGDGQCTIVASNCRSVGYSEGMFRAFGGMYLDYCYGDARSQFHSPSTNLFGFHVQDAIAGVTTDLYPLRWRNCAFLHHDASAPAGSSKDPAITGAYGQGDGGVGEENTLQLESYNNVSRYNYDRGYDGKHAIPLGMLHNCWFDNNGFNVAAHNDLVEAYITDSYLGPTRRLAGDTGKSAPLQGSGHLTAVRCVIEQNVATASNFLGVWYGSVQAQHVQSGVTVPQRTGKGVVQDCDIRIKAGLSESLNSPGGSPVTTPTYARTGDSRLTTV